jgi:hypothetical protein
MSLYPQRWASGMSYERFRVSLPAMTANPAFERTAASALRLLAGTLVASLLGGQLARTFGPMKNPVASREE